MGNPDLVIIVNRGERSFLIRGTEYSKRKDAVGTALTKWEEWTKDVKKVADRSEKLFFEIKEILIVELYD